MSDADGLHHDGVVPAGAALEDYGRRLAGLVLRRLDGGTHRKVDPEDIAQSAIRSYLNGCAEGRFVTESADDLWKLLVVIALRKCRRSASRLRAAKRDVRREVDLPALDGRDVVDLAFPRPDEVALATDLLEALLSSAKDTERQILLDRLAGFSPPEIAGRVGVSERKVFRVLAKARERLADA